LVKNDYTIPHLKNLHEDPDLSGLVYYPISSGEIHIGRKTGDPVPQVILGAVGIKPNHAKITLLPNGLFEMSVCDSEAAANTMINGKQIKRSKA
jgi:kinesin family member 1